MCTASDVSANELLPIMLWGVVVGIAPGAHLLQTQHAQLLYLLGTYNGVISINHINYPLNCTERVFQYARKNCDGCWITI
jgi:hypothetical protein